MKKKNLRIMSKQYAHLHAMAKTSVKFQNDWPKTVGGVALTSQLLTNGQTDKRTGHGTPISHLHANTGATKRDKSIFSKKKISEGKHLLKVKKGHNSHNNGLILPYLELDLYFMIIYLCVKFEFNTLMFSKGIKLKLFFNI